MYDVIWHACPGCGHDIEFRSYSLGSRHTLELDGLTPEQIRHFAGAESRCGVCGRQWVLDVPVRLVIRPADEDYWGV